MDGKKSEGLATKLVHSDGAPADGQVAPAITLSTTFRVPREIDTNAIDPADPSHHVYSRYTTDGLQRVEKVLGDICNGFALTYASGLASIYAALVHLKPKRIAISGGYHGSHETIEIYRRFQGSQFEIITLDDPYQAGDVCWLETPLNPTGESRSIELYAKKAHAAGAKIVVDSTFAPPPLQDPFKWGADMIMHSGTKYFGGHSDLLCGVLVVKNKEEWMSLWKDRTYMGNRMGSLEVWLLLRSLRTLHLRVQRQSETATALVAWLKRIADLKVDDTLDGVKGGLISRIWHSSLQQDSAFDVKAQMEGGYNATFGLLLEKAEWAAALPFACEYFVSATSLGGIESLMEQRQRSDPEADPRLIRISVGVEDLEDLKKDLRRAFAEVRAGQSSSESNARVA